MSRLFLKRAMTQLDYYFQSLISLPRPFLSTIFNAETADRLIIYDDTFPELASPFRIAEFNAYLEHFSNCFIYSSNGGYKRAIETYAKYYPQHYRRIFKFNKILNFRGRLAYIAFLHNMFNFLPFIEKYQLPFVFELYPGGYFMLNDEVSDYKLRSILSSRYFRKVIVTQKITYDYLIEHKFCSPEKIEFIFGVVLTVDVLSSVRKDKKYYPVGKQSFDICFIANKHMFQGKDKGYDVFVDVAKRLSQKYRNMHFHVVGNFDETDIYVGDIKDRIHFYGHQATYFFPDFYSGMDIMLSPNRPHILSKGAFDGFPTGCCIEAALCGVAVFCTDMLNQNIAFDDRKDIVIIPPDPDKIFSLIEYYYNNYDELYELSINGQKRFKDVFSKEALMGPRLKILDDLYYV